MKKSLGVLVGGLTLFLISACATTQSAAPPAGSPAEMVAQLETDLATANKDQVDVLAPELFAQANASLMKAKQALAKGAKLSTISLHVAEGGYTLKKAEEIAQVSRTILSKTNAARKKAQDVGAKKLGKPYSEVEAQYLTLTKAIGNDNLSYAQKNAPKVQAAFRNLEIMAIKNNALGNARARMADIERIKIEKIAPTAYRDAAKALSDADNYIGKNPYEAEAISQKAFNAEFMTERAMKIGASSRKFESMSPEASALYLESVVMRLGEALPAGDVRDKDIEDQISTLTATAAEKERSYLSRQSELEANNQSLESDKSILQKQVNDLEQRMAGLKGFSQEQEAAKKKLTAEREFNQRFDVVQRYFRSDEAEVYKQGGQLVIRMRGIKFPVGQSTLTPDNYTLLSKVQQAIQTFGQPAVIIEGHTDSTGSASQNQVLSQKRAEAVKTYLIANETLPENRLKATGYGPGRPLAPNTTPEGRATNRRIDLLINPSN